MIGYTIAFYTWYARLLRYYLSRILLHCIAGRLHKFTQPYIARTYPLHGIHKKLMQACFCAGIKNKKGLLLTGLHFYEISTTGCL